MSNDVSISGVHVDLTDALKKIVNEKTQKLFNHNGKIIRVNISLEYDANKSKTGEFAARGEIEIGGPNLVARAASDDLYKSIDQLINKLDRQLTDKSKIENSRKEISSRVSAPSTDLTR